MYTLMYNISQVDLYDEAGIAAYKSHLKDYSVEAPKPIHSISVNHPVSYISSFIYNFYSIVRILECKLSFS